MRSCFAVLTVLACSALTACGDGDAPAAAERPKDFRAAADEVCREHNVRVSKVRDRIRDRRPTLDELVDAIREEALVKEHELRDLRALKPPAEAKPYLARLRRNVEGMRKGALEIRADDDGASYNTFFSTLANSDGLARDLAEELGLRDCSPPTAQL